MSEEQQPSKLEIEERTGAIVIKLMPQNGVMNYAILPTDPVTKSMQAMTIKKKLEARTLHVIRSLKKENKTPEFIAAEIVNILLSEVL